MQSKRIVVTGLGALTSLGVGKDELWRNILQEKTNVRLEKKYLDDEIWESFFIHRVDNFDISNFGIDIESLREVRNWIEDEDLIDLFYLLALVKLSLVDSKLEYNIKSNNIGLILTCEGPGVEHFFSKILNQTFNFKKDNYTSFKKKDFLEKIYKECAKNGYNLQTFMYLFLVARAFNIHGYSLFINNACASGVYALECAANVIRSGLCPAVIVLGGDYADVYKYKWFKELNMYAEDGKIKPFSKKANGYVFGDGGGAFVLEDLEHAIKRKAIIYAEYVSSGFSLESWKVTVPAVAEDFYKDALMQALSRARIGTEDVDLICAHGVGTKIGDIHESRVIKAVFKEENTKPLITAFKPFIGHNLGGNALIESVILLLALINDSVPPILNCEDPIPLLKEKLITKFTKTKINIAVKMSCGFAGYNGVAIFRKMR
ncbi:MAG: hypothetical protein ISS47_09540 [Candidatus Omnitrophica bacterium]|nr:hypothetical protein [Candidatus Omnitrophota bacterium]